LTERYWFRPKTFGYGATPITWEGWGVMLGSAIVTIFSILTVVLSEAQHWPDRRPIQGAGLVVFVATMIATIIISRKKTDGEWKLRR
jgi:hypothetical protein